MIYTRMFSSEYQIELSSNDDKSELFVWSMITDTSASATTDPRHPEYASDYPQIVTNNNHE